MISLPWWMVMVGAAGTVWAGLDIGAGVARALDRRRERRFRSGR